MESKEFVTCFICKRRIDARDALYHVDTGRNVCVPEIKQHAGVLREIEQGNLKYRKPEIKEKSE